MGVPPTPGLKHNTLLSRFLSDHVAMFTQAMGMTASDWSVSDVVKTRQGNYLLKSYFFLSQKLLFSVLILRLKAQCLSKNFSTLAFFWGEGAQILQ